MEMAFEIRFATYLILSMVILVTNEESARNQLHRMIYDAIDFKEIMQMAVLKLKNISSEQSDFHNIINILEKESTNHKLIDKLSYTIDSLKVEHGFLPILRPGIMKHLPIKILVLNDTRTSVLMPGALDYMPTLLQIGIYNCPLRIIYKDSFRKLYQLLALALKHNRISYLEIGCFNDLTSLQYLYLDSNKLHNVNRGHFSQLLQLQHLSLNYNLIKFLDTDTFKDISNLHHLHLKGNKIIYFDTGLFLKMSHLLQLDLASNHVIYIGNDIFKGLSSLKTLSLSDNQVIYLNIKAFRYLRNLTEIHLDYNSVNCVSGRLLLYYLKKLTVLSLAVDINSELNSHRILDCFYSTMCNLNYSMCPHYWDIKLQKKKLYFTLRKLYGASNGK